MLVRTGRAKRRPASSNNSASCCAAWRSMDCFRRCRFQQQMAGDLLSRLHVLRSIANPEPPQLTDLPESLVHRFVGQHGRYLLKIYGRGNIWDTEALGQFVKDVRTVDPHVTGNPLQAYEASFEMKRSYQEAAIYSLLVIIGVLVLDFRSIRYSLIAALPLAVGMLQTFGLLGLFEHSAQSGQSHRPAADPGNRRRLWRTHRARIPRTARTLSHVAGHGRGRASRWTDDDCRLWFADDRQSPGLAKSGTAC